MLVPAYRGGEPAGFKDGLCQYDFRMPYAVTYDFRIEVEDGQFGRHGFWGCPFVTFWAFHLLLFFCRHIDMQGVVSDTLRIVTDCIILFFSVAFIILLTEPGINSDSLVMV